MINLPKSVGIYPWGIPHIRNYPRNILARPGSWLNGPYGGFSNAPVLSPLFSQNVVDVAYATQNQVCVAYATRVGTIIHW